MECGPCDPKAPRTRPRGAEAAGVSGVSGEAETEPKTPRGIELSTDMTRPAVKEASMPVVASFPVTSAVPLDVAGTG